MTVRRISIAGVCLLASILAFCGKPELSTSAGVRKVPVFIISIDTLRSDRLPSYGYPRGSTPAIDRFRKDAILFRSAFSPAPLTLPAHASLMTGLLPYNHGVRDNLGYALASERESLAETLKAHGYATGAAVSSAVLRRDTGIAAGFDAYDDAMTVSPQQTISSWMRDGDVTREILTNWLDSPKSDETFGFLHLYEPHMPYTPPEPFASQFADPYDGEVAYADAITGRFLDDLRAKGLYDRALIVVMSDHGEGLGDHGELEHGVFLYREAIQVPLLVKLPMNERGGDEIGTPASIADIMPTILARIGVRAPTGLDGVDLFSLSPDSDRTIYSESYFQRLHYGWKELISLVGPKHHYIDAPAVELYDYRVDPGEKANLASEQRRIVAALRSEVAALAAARPFEPPRVESPEDVAKLTALGYLGSGAIEGSGALPDPKDEIEALTLVGRGSAWLQKGEYQKAVDVGRQLLKHNPDFTHGWGLIGAAYHKMGKRELALEALREQMKRSPGNPQVTLTMATIFAELGRYDEARTHAELVLSSAPMLARELLANVAIAEGKLDVAEAEATKCLEIDPSRVQALMLLASVRQGQQRSGDELALLDRARSTIAEYRMPKVRELEFRRGELLLRAGRVRDAEAAFREETATFPDNLHAWTNRALVVGGQGRTEEARAILGQARQKNPGEPMGELARAALRVIDDGARGGETLPSSKR